MTRRQMQKGRTNVVMGKQIPGSIKTYSQSGWREHCIRRRGRPGGGEYSHYCDIDARPRITIVSKLEERERKCR